MYVWKIGQECFTQENKIMALSINQSINNQRIKHMIKGATHVFRFTRKTDEESFQSTKIGGYDR